MEEINWLFKEKYKNKLSKNYYKDIERLKAGEPVDYVIGFKDFLGTKIDLSKKTLIPRAETEFWVKSLLCDIKEGAKVLDLFSGSGCIGIVVLKNIQNSKVVFADKEKNCLEQTRINLRTNKVNGKVVESDVFSNINGKYDYIFANPPYVATSKKHLVQKSVLENEPHSALFGGKDGLFYIKKFLKQAGNFLKPCGKIFMEFSPEQKKKIRELLSEYGYKNYKFGKDQHNRWRFVVACQSKSDNIK